MFRRILKPNKIYVTAFEIQCLKSNSIVQPLRRYNSVYAIHAVQINSTRDCVFRRFYSENVKLEEIIVDYDHVKNATSNAKSLIVDVREPEEIKEHGKIPNSINIPLGNVSTALGSMSDSEFHKIYKRPKPTEDTEIIFYCMIGKRSGMAQQNAVNLGYKNVKNYLGSWTEWASKSI